MCSLKPSYSVRSMCQAFRREFRPEIPFRVYKKKVEGALGETRIYCDDGGNPVHIRVSLDPRLCGVAVECVLEHELAHVLQLNKNPDATMNHGMLFETCLGEVHRTLFDTD